MICNEYCHETMEEDNKRSPMKIELTPIGVIKADGEKTSQRWKF